MAGSPPLSSSGIQGLDLHLVRDDAWYRAQQALHLIPADGGDGVVRRAIFFSLLAWLPPVAWAWMNGVAFASVTGEPLLRHLGIHSRFLIALPALIIGERVAASVMKRLLPRFISVGLVPEEKVPAFRDLVTEVVKLKNSFTPWAVGIAVMIAAVLVPQTGANLNELDWARQGDGLGFGGWWYLFVSRPLFQIFVMAWVWRLILVTIMLKRIAKLGLRPIATHPDKLGGLGFIEAVPRGFAPFVFALSCVLCGHFAHDIAWHGVHVSSLKLPIAIFAVIVFLICVTPLFVFIPLLKKTRRGALSEYGDLLARHNREVHRKWITGERAEEPDLLDAPELGATIDANSMYDAVRAMRTLPFSRQSLLAVAVPVAVPLLVVASMEIPLGEMLMKIFKTVI